MVLNSFLAGKCLTVHVSSQTGRVWTMLGSKKLEDTLHEILENGDESPSSTAPSHYRGHVSEQKRRRDVGKYTPSRQTGSCVLAVAIAIDMMAHDEDRKSK